MRGGSRWVSVTVVVVAVVVGVWMAWPPGLKPSVVTTERAEALQGKPPALASAAVPQPQAAQPDAPAVTPLTQAAADAQAGLAPASAMSLDQAEASMRERRIRRECAMTRRAADPENLQRLQQKDWRWLPPDQVAAERAAYLQALAARLRNCPPSTPEQDAAAQRADHALLAAAARAGELSARLEMLRYTPVGQHDPVAIRQLFDEILRGGDPELIASISLHEMYLNPGATVRLRQQTPLAWELVACDLGRECGPGSEALGRWCLRQPAVCTQANVEDAMRQITPPELFARMQGRRAELLARIRAGQIGVIFELPRESNAGRGP